MAAVVKSFHLIWIATNVAVKKNPQYQHIEAETIWSPFRRRHFKTHFHNETFRISIEISLKFVPKGPINNIPALVQAIRRQAIIWTSDGQFTDAYMHHSASMS